MTVLSERLREKYFGNDEHPYKHFEREVERLLHRDSTLLDAGCGRTAPVLTKFKGKVKELIGVDIVDFDSAIDGSMKMLNNDLSNMKLDSCSVDVVMSRSVMEHVEEPLAVYLEINRILKHGGHFVFLTANLWDYAAIIAKFIPNRFHPWIVSNTEGRQEDDVFPTQYRTNTFRSVNKWARKAGFEIVTFRYLGQYPCYFMFNGALFFLATGYEKLIGKFDALRFLRGWIFVILKKSKK
jgi:SAM-dependent methyltransferase